MRHLYQIKNNNGTAQIFSALKEICGQRELNPTDQEAIFHVHLSAAEAKKLRIKGCKVQRVLLKNPPVISSPSFGVRNISHSSSKKVRK